ncbi:MAG: metal ABC transporter permease [Planctomycetaceae bacterium]|nr:metal ABC transporter permease [Planctomycetaceae bacterium]
MNVFAVDLFAVDLFAFIAAVESGSLAEQLRHVVQLEQYNTRVVIPGVTALGCCAGLVGSFTLLRRRALMGDALSHATLPGIALAFILVTLAGGDGKSLPVLLLGATLSGLLGVAAILLIRNLTRLKEDAALGIVLSVFFGAGVALLGVAQQMPAGHAAGLESFIYGKTASMKADDARLIMFAAAGSFLVCVMLFKELKLLCFDEGFAGSEGYPLLLLDLVLMSLVVVTSIVGLQAVGLVLVIALLVIPAAAARFWTAAMWKTAAIASLIGGLGGLIGAVVSAVFERLPSGAMIVLVCAAMFLLSLLFGTHRGVVVRQWRRMALNRSIDHQHLLRAIYELSEAAAASRRSGNSEQGVAGANDVREPPAVLVADLVNMRSWSLRRLQRQIRRSHRAGWIVPSGDSVRLTAGGAKEAARLTRQHRLWELYLITHADVAAATVDRDADSLEHVLEPEIVAELESLLDHGDDVRPPVSPHEMVLPSSLLPEHVQSLSTTGEGPENASAETSGKT